ncbi:MAG: hypothetical protein RMI91_11915 [Gemmatales bacterium]|nr:hypothetical protein [Gemmatales bacterium]MDW7995346.1 hypothetical protein [Gemmatales bacterium]
MWEVTIRGEGGGFLNIALISRPHPEASDYWDSNWISASVEVKAGGFRGSASGHLRAEELAEFHRQLAQLQESLWGTAEFTTMEGWLSIRVEGDGLGHMTCRVVVRDEPSVGNTLDCTLRTDQTFTRSTVAELAAAVQVFPVVGSP